MVVYASVEDFLYILAGILWVAFSFYNSKRKKDAKKGKQKEKSSSPLIDSLLEELGMETEKQPEKVSTSHTESGDLILQTKSEPIQEVNPSIEPQNIFSYDDYFDKSNDTPMADVIEKYGSTDDQDQGLILKELDPFKKTSKKIDLRKAVIYSEILRKQYF
jgi:hypothetical protein